MTPKEQAAGIYRLADGIDVDRLKHQYSADGHVRIEPFLKADDADALRIALEARQDWLMVLNSGSKLFELSKITLESMEPDRREALDRAVVEAGRYGFQYRYRAIRVADDAEETQAPDDPLIRFVAFLRSDPMVHMVRRIIGVGDVDFADGQATRYEAGDFLTAHDDAVAGKHRHAAYVMGLTKGWRAEWGGLLLFHGNDDRLVGRRPAFNGLDLFKVPSVHSVSCVNPSAVGSRLSVTGWFRSSR